MSIHNLQSKVKKNSEKFYTELKTLIKSNEYIKIIDLIKKSNITIDEYGSGNLVFKDLINQINTIIKPGVDSYLEFDKLFNESEIFNNIYKSINNEFSKIDRLIANGLHLVTFLVELELELRRLELASQNMIKEKKNEINYFPYSHEMQKIMDLTGTILKYFKYKKFEPSLKCIYHEVKPNIAKVSGSYLRFASIWVIVKEINDLWCTSNLNISKEKEYIIFNSRNTNSINKEVAGEMYYSISSAKETKFTFFDLNKVKKYKTTDVLPPNEFISYEEECAYEFLTQILFCGDGIIKKSNITIMQLLRAYSVIVECSKSYHDRNSNQEGGYSLDKLCIVKSREYWLDQFKLHGIPEEIVKEVFQLLVFDNSRDLIDCPFYKIEDNYIVLPSIAKRINAGKSLLSNLASKSIDISFKGKLFENHLKNILNKAGVKNSCIKRKINGIEYECDLVFEINNDVFFVEAKNLSPITCYRDYDKNCAVLKDACTQLNKLSIHVTNNENIKELLRINEIKSFNRIVLSSMPIGELIAKDGVIVTDEIYFSGYFLRNAPKIHNINQAEKRMVSISLYDEYYTGEFSKEQFIELISNIPLQKSIKKKRIQNDQITIDELKLKYKYSLVGIESVTISTSPDFFQDSIYKYT